jgi:flagellar hook-associated protein 1 FlgK
MALDQLANLTGAVSTEQKNGEMVVSIGGHVLVVGHDAFKLHTQTNSTPPNVGMSDIYWSDGQLMTPTSGSLKGTLEARDQILVGQLGGLNTLANGLITQVNAIHLAGYGPSSAIPVPPALKIGDLFFSGDSAGNISVNNDLVLDPGKIATADAPNQAGNNSIALKIAALKTSKGMAAGTATLNEYYNTQITSLAVTTQRAVDNTYQHGLVAKALSDQRESVAGVNLDEEAANMAKTQKAYQAAARMLTTMDELLDLVINRMGLTGR